MGRCEVRIEARGAAWAVLLVVGCNGEVQPDLASRAGETVCAVQKHLEENAPKAIGTVEGIVEKAGVMTASEITEGKQALATAGEIMRIPAAEAQALLAQGVNCKVLASTAEAVLRDIGTVLRP